MANNLSKKQLEDIIRESEKKSSDPHVGEIAKRALQRARTLLADLERSETMANNSRNVSQHNSTNAQGSNSSNGQRSNTAQNATPNTTIANAANSVGAQNTGNAPQQTAQQPTDQPIGSVASQTDAGSGPYVIVDGKPMSIGEVRSKIITYLNHSSNSQSVNSENWGLYIRRQTFRTLLFWIQAFALFPRTSQEEFPTKEDVGSEYFRSKDRKIIYNLVKAAHEKEGDVTEIVQNIQNYLNQQN
jgi:hypothetical protein